MSWCFAPPPIPLWIQPYRNGMGESRVMLDGKITLKTNDVKDLIITITPEKWTNFCNHVENKIEPQYWKSDHIIEEIPKIIINLDSDSDTDSEGDHDSEGETTDMYWSE